MTNATPSQSGAHPADARPHRYTAQFADAIETRWQRWWADHDTFVTPNPGDPGFDASRPKYYALDMFPYPSGAGLHVGHPEGYIATDIVSRFKRMTGHNVLHPMGWDAFGLPAEQHAIATNVHPSKTTRAAIQTFRRQLQRFGFSYDWSREIATIDENYYRWTQWIFLKLYNAWYDPAARGGAGGARHIDTLTDLMQSGDARVGDNHTLVNRTDPGFDAAQPWGNLSPEARRAFIDNHRLAYIDEQTVNWCPKLGTVLANEEVIDGKSERGGFPVSRRPLRQWMLRITAYAERLLTDLDDLEWPNSTKTQQAEWIGRSEGAEIDFTIIDPPHAFEGDGADRRALRVFTTRPDTLCGATYMVVAPEHDLVAALLDDPAPETPAADLRAYVDAARNRSDVERQETKEKTGVFTGLHARNPANDQRIPIWTADYVLKGYGTGAIMAVPAHDSRDYEFAKAFNLPIRDVVYPRTILAIRHYVNNATEAEARSETWFWTLADFLGIVTSGDLAPDAFPDALARARTRRKPDEAPSSTVDVARLGHDIPGAIGERRGVVRVSWMEAIEALGFESFAELRDAIQSATFYARTGEAFSGSGHVVNSPPIDALTTADAKASIADILEQRGQGRATVNYKLRDWLFSRQRYWGEPFPIVFDEKGNHYPVAESALPVTLPPLEDFKPPESEDPQPLLGKANDWVTTTAGAAGVDPDVLPPDTPVRRETNTMPNWAGSCWYYLRFVDPKAEHRFVSRDAEQYWLGANAVDLYIGGAEHAVLHLLYARFWHKALYDLGELDSPEPFRRLFHQGMITSFAYQRADKTLVPADEVEERAGAHVERASGQPVTQVIAKMSKSLKNVVNPDAIIQEFGADTFRLYEMYMGPLEASKPWNTNDTIGLFRFLQRTWRLAVNEDNGDLLLADAPDADVERALHKTIAKVEADIDRLAFNTAIASMYEFVNLATKKAAESGAGAGARGAANGGSGGGGGGGLTRDQLDRFARLLAPFVPHVAEELWSKLGNEPPVSLASWPSHDPAMLVEDEIEVPVQIMGKVRAKIMIPAGADAKTMESLALAHDKVQAQLEGKTVRKVVAVPGKLVNIVAN